MQRVISGVVLAAAAVAAILFLPLVVLRVLTSVLALLAGYEYVKVTGAHPIGAAGALVACWVMAGGQPALGFQAVAWLTLVVTVLPVMLVASPVHRSAASAFAAAYIGLPLGMLVLVQQNFGPKGTLFLIASVVVSDTSQYYCGRAFGRRPLAPAISPKKTIEGAIGGVVCGAAFIAVVGGLVFGLSPLFTVPFGVLVVALGIIGDLFESRLKRASGVKDSSTLIPGHGGVLDRIDALLFVIPAFYFMLVRSVA